MPRTRGVTDYHAPPMPHTPGRSGTAAMLALFAGAAPHALLGDALGLGTAVFYAAYILVVARLRARHGTGMVMFASTLVFTLLLAAPARSPRVLANQPRYRIDRRAPRSAPAPHGPDVPHRHGLRERTQHDPAGAAVSAARGELR
jgi:hypothetical protein